MGVVCLEMATKAICTGRSIELAECGVCCGPRGAHAAMKVTRPVMVMADLYFSSIEPTRSQKKMVEAIIDASVKLSELYTRSNISLVMGCMAAVCASTRTHARATCGVEGVGAGFAHARCSCGWCV